jgi:phosphoribosylglycinamide formyltransferase 1
MTRCDKTIKLAVFASGTGSNARKIVEYFWNNSGVEVSLIATNKEKAGVLYICKEYYISKLSFPKEYLQDSQRILHILEEEKIDYIILAGFLLKIPEYLIKAYPQKIINIHPSLLPKFGGKGMYGHHVHEAVILAGEKKSGITIHTIDEHYDRGKIIKQIECDVDVDETPESLALKIQKIEHDYFPKTIEEFIYSDTQ